MEVVLVALITTFGSVIVALIMRSDKRATEAREAAVEAFNAQIATNGSLKPLGELSEAIYKEVRQNHNAVRRVEAAVKKHNALPGHPELEKRVARIEVMARLPKEE